MADEMLRQATEAEAWSALVRSAHRWASAHMDQWEQVKFQTDHGTVYLTLSLRSDHPDAFDPVDAEGQAVRGEADRG